MAGCERGCRTIDECRGWIVGDEAARELRRDEPGGGGMRRQDVEHLLAIPCVAAGTNAMAEHRLLAVVVHPRDRSETNHPAAASTIVQPGEGASDFLTSCWV